MCVVVKLGVSLIVCCSNVFVFLYCLIWLVSLVSIWIVCVLNGFCLRYVFSSGLVM